MAEAIVEREPLYDRFTRRVRLGGWLEAETALRIGAGRSMEVTGTDLPVVRDSLGRPYIPGSSFKGPLRVRAESFVRAIRDTKEAACDPVGKEDKWCLASAERLSDEEVLQRTCRVCRLFGSHWFASRLRIRDLLVDGAQWYGQFEVRNGVALDRDTETAAKGLLYDFEVVPAGTRFRCEIEVENPARWQLGLLWVALQPFLDGDGALGGGRSRGLGAVRLELDQQTLVEAEGLDLLDYMAGIRKPEPITEKHVEAWIGELREELRRLAGGAHAQAAAE